MSFVQGICLFQASNGRVICKNAYSNDLVEGRDGGDNDCIASYFGSPSVIPDHQVPVKLLTQSHYIVQVTKCPVIVQFLSKSDVDLASVIRWSETFLDLLFQYHSSLDFNVDFNPIYLIRLMDEMTAYGTFPISMDLDEIKKKIPPPSFITHYLQKIIPSASQSPDCYSHLKKVSPAVPWRRAGIIHSPNEVYFDLIHILDGIFDSAGHIINLDILGKISCSCQLSGMPDLTMKLQNQSSIDDYSFHPCVRLLKYQKYKEISFIPPDGSFDLMDFRLKEDLNLVKFPLSVSPKFLARNGQNFLEIWVNNGFGREINTFGLELQLPESITECIVVSSAGTGKFDKRRKLITLTAEKLKSNARFSISIKLLGNMTNPEDEDWPSINVSLSMSGYSWSGISIDSLQINRETFQASKGVRVVTMSSNLEFRINK